MHYGIGHIVRYPPFPRHQTWGPTPSPRHMVATETRVVGKRAVRILQECCLVVVELTVRRFVFRTDTERHEPVSRPDASHDPQEMSGDEEDVREDRSVRGKVNQLEVRSIS